jgi:hypothetical protein
MKVTSSSEELRFPLNIGKPSRVVPVWKYMCLPGGSDTHPFRTCRMTLACTSAIPGLLPAFVRYSLFPLCMTKGSNASTTALCDIQNRQHVSFTKTTRIYIESASVALVATHNTIILTLVITCVILTLPQYVLTART